MKRLESEGELRSDRPPPAICAEAAAWIARLHGADRSRALEAGFKRWLEADAAHARAFELATEAWEIGGSVNVPGWSRSRDPVERSRFFGHRRQRLLFAAMTACALVASACLHLAYRTPVLSTGIGEQRMLILDDGTRAYLNTDTRLVVVKDPHRRGVSLETGEAMFDVAKDPHRPFVVSVGQQEVMALGTSFVVRRESAATSITLLEGKVAVSSPDVVSSPESERTLRATRDAAAVPLVAAVSTHDPVYTLAPGQRLILAENRQAKLDEPALEKITAWRRGEVVLDKTRLQDAANEMNRYSDVKLTVADPRVADIRVSGIFRVGDSVRFARAVSETYHLTLTSDESSIVIH